MRALRRLAVLVLVFWASGAASQARGSIFPRVQELVNSGNRPRARALADSAMNAAPSGSELYAEALFARAFASSDAVAAERDYLRLTIEFPRSARLEEALFLSGQFRMARQDNAGARRQFERLVLEFPESENTARAALWAGRMALADGDTGKGCATLAIGSRRASDIELRNEIEYLRSRCQAAMTLQADTARTVIDTLSTTSAVAEFSVQVAAYSRRSDAAALGDRLRRRGFQVRVAGDRAPYRVRIGRYGSREAAEAALVRMKRSNVTGMVVEAEPR
ncbi:MAG: SPOR domain-containing protein [Gemmatimonadota bacterium]